MILIEITHLKLKYIRGFFPQKLEWERLALNDQVFIPLCVCIHEHDGSWTAFSGVPTEVKPLYQELYAPYQERDRRTGENEENGLMNSDALYEADARRLFPQYQHLKYYQM